MTYATKRMFGGQRVSVGCVVLICVLFDREPHVIPATVTAITVCDLAEVRAADGYIEYIGMGDALSQDFLMPGSTILEFVNLTTEQSVEQMEPSQCGWPPRA